MNEYNGDHHLQAHYAAVSEGSTPAPWLGMDVCGIVVARRMHRALPRALPQPEAPLPRLLPRDVRDPEEEISTP